MIDGSFVLFRRCRFFSGVAPNTITFGPNTVYNLNTTKTIGIRFRTASTTNAAMRLLSKRNDSISTGNGYEIILNPAAKQITVSHVGVGSLNASLAAYNLLLWHQVVWTTSAVGLQNIYVDGQLLATTTFAAPEIDTAVPLYLGDVGHNGLPYTGFLCEVAIQNVELDSAQVLQQFKDQEGLL